MSQVSKRFVAEDVSSRIQELFYGSFSEIRGSRELEELLLDLLTPTERIMLSKRLAIAYMLLSGYQYSSICEVLKVSKTTVWSVRKQIEMGAVGYKKILGRVSRKEEFRKKWTEIEYAMGIFMPLYVGKNFGRVRKGAEETKKRKQKPF